MIEYRDAIIFKSFNTWLAVFGYGDYVETKTEAAARRAVDLRRGEQ